MAPLRDEEGSFLANARFVHHKYTEIPKEQEKLLSRPDAWDTRGIPNLPPTVLQDVKEAYARQLMSDTASERATREKTNSHSVNGSPRQKGGNPNIGAGNDLDDKSGRHSEHSDDEDEEPIPWTPSPTYHKQPPGRRDELPTSRPNNLHAPSSSPVRPSERHAPTSSPIPCEGLPPPSSPPIPARRASPAMIAGTPAKKAARAQLVVALTARSARRAPPSSLASEPDIEYQPPRAITDVVSPVGQVLRSTKPSPPTHRNLRSRKQPVSTPPSAQEPVTVPCTWKRSCSPEKRRPAHEEPPQKRRRLHKPPPFESSQAIDENRLGAPPGGAQEPSDVKGSQTDQSASSSSVIARTPAKRNLSPVHGSEPKARVFAVLPRPAPLTKVIQLDEQDCDGSQLPVRPVMDGSLSSSGRLPPNGPASQAPFVAFKVAYPTYTGTLRDFVSAALTIIQLQESHSLAEFLYDDFIRVWAHDYVPYVADCLNDGGKPLRAIHWYNEYVQRPVFTKRIFTKGNITDITEQHRPEAESYSRQIGYLLYSSSSLPAAASPAARVNSPPGLAGLSRERSTLNNDIKPRVAGSSPQTVPAGTLVPEGEVLPRKDSARARSTQREPSGDTNIQITLRTSQVEKIEPLRSVAGYVVTICQAGASPSTIANDQLGRSPRDAPEVNNEEHDRAQAQAQVHLNANADLKAALPATPGSMSSNSTRLTTSHGPAKPLKSNRSDAFRTATNQSQAEYILSQPPAISVSPTDTNIQVTAINPPQPRRGPPLPGLEVLTQPPATAVSSISDFTRSMIPETAIKPKEVSVSTPPLDHNRPPVAMDTDNRLPMSSAATTSSTARRRRLTKAERFRLFVQKRMAQSIT